MNAVRKPTFMEMLTVCASTTWTSDIIFSVHSSHTCFQFRISVLILVFSSGFQFSYLFSVLDFSSHTCFQFWISVLILGFQFRVSVLILVFQFRISDRRSDHPEGPKSAEIPRGVQVNVPFFSCIVASTSYSCHQCCVMWIRDILVQIRIRGSVPLTSGSGSCYTRPWP
jgi:hypothetical protein